MRLTKKFPHNFGRKLVWPVRLIWPIVDHQLCLNSLMGMLTKNRSRTSMNISIHIRPYLWLFNIIHASKSHDPNLLFVQMSSWKNGWLKAWSTPTCGLGLQAPGAHPWMWLWDAPMWGHKRCSSSYCLYARHMSDLFHDIFWYMICTRTIPSIFTVPLQRISVW